MEFERRRPKWPMLAGMLLVAAMAVAAPWSWKRLGHMARRPSVAPATTSGPLASLPAAPVEPTPEPPPGVAPFLPPFAGELALHDPAHAAARPSRGGAPPEAEVADGPIVAFEDYDDYPLPAEPALAVVAPQLPASEPLPASSVEPLAPGHGAAWGAVTPPAPSAPATLAKLQVEDLQRARDALWQLLARVRDFERTQDSVAAEAAADSQVASAAPPQVRVESEHDRLAYAEPRRATTPPATAPDADQEAAAEERVARTVAQRLQTPATPLDPGRVAWQDRTLGATEQDDAAPPTLTPSIVPTGPKLAISAAVRAQVRSAGAYPAAVAWAQAATAQLERIAELTTPRPDRREQLQRLEQLTATGFSSALECVEPMEQRAWLGACRALERRIPLWRAQLDPVLEQAAAEGGNPDGAALRLALHDTAALTAGSPAGTAWQQFLRLEELHALTSAGGQTRGEQLRQTARDVLARLQSASLTAEQQAFLALPPLVRLTQGLQSHAAGPVALDRLAEILERYESARSEGDADALAEACRRLALSPHAELRELGAALDRNYRNANVRLAFTDDLLNRLIPAQPPVVAPVNDRVAGAEVRGRSQTQTELRIRLQPAADRWKLALEAAGLVHSRTYSDAWPARVRNAGDLHFAASKVVLLGKDGLRTEPAAAEAYGKTELVDVDTHFDPLPLLGDWFQNLARQRHDERRPLALAQAKRKVAAEAQRRLDEETERKLRDLERSFAASVLEPLQALAVAAEPVDMHSTEKRAVMRLRMADRSQLAAHTPRPSAPSDSLMSFQVHESALNNAAAGLDLSGRRLTIEELHATLAARLSRVPLEAPEDLPRRAVIEFASHDAVRIHCQGDRVRLTLSLEEMALGRDAIRRVKVHANFLPEVRGLGIELVRDGALEFEGARLRTGERMALHGVFNKLIRKDDRLELLPAALADDPRFAGLMVTQLVIDDGWVALAVGPAAAERTAWRSVGGTQFR